MYHPIEVRKVARGFYAQVGCAKLIYRDTTEDIEELCKDFSEYVKDPAAKTKWYNEMFCRNVVEDGLEERSMMAQSEAPTER